MRFRQVLSLFLGLLCAAAATLGAGCSTSSSDAYDKQISAANAAYESGKITTAEYLKLKQDAQNAYLQRQSNN